MKVQRIAAFSLGTKGGNPAGVVLLEEPLSEAEMARIAAEVGYSETAFAVRRDNAPQEWRVRYFAPESEVPFCGHATIALGAVLGQSFGAGSYTLILNDATITVASEASPDGMMANLASPPTASRALSQSEANAVMDLFGLTDSDLEPGLEPAHIHAGANHFVVPLADRETLAAMHYDLDRGRVMMLNYDLATIMLVFVEDERTFVARNAFASGGVFEDPATGAAAAAFAGYLRDRRWPHGGHFTVRQGEDMGCPSLIEVWLDDRKGASVRVAGVTRKIAP